MFLKVGSVHLMLEDYLQNASKVGRISAGSYIKILKYDESSFTVQRCSVDGALHKNSYPHKVCKRLLVEKI